MKYILKIIVMLKNNNMNNFEVFYVKKINYLVPYYSKFAKIFK